MSTAGRNNASKPTQMACGATELPPDVFDRHAEICAALSHGKRLRIVALIAAQEMSVGDLAAALGVALSNVSQHLTLLKAQGLLLSRREGQTIFYRLADRRIIEACILIRAVVLERLNLDGGTDRGSAPAQYRKRLAKPDERGGDTPLAPVAGPAPGELPGAARTIDASMVPCPGPLLAAKSAISSINVGEVLEVISADPGTVEDMPLWAGRVGHEYLGSAQDSGKWRLFIRRLK